jgi:hypothetical protein
MDVKKAALGLAASAALGLGTVVATTGTAFAYGSADNPVAQVEISANCDNPSFPLCAPPSQGGVGLGGVWAWAELGTNTGSGTFADPSPMDSTVTFCSHGSPGQNGTSGSPDPFGVWYEAPSLQQAFQDAGPAASPFYNPSTYRGPVRVLDFFPGSGNHDFIAVVPATQGHYSLKPAPAVSIETQVAP